MENTTELEKRNSPNNVVVEENLTGEEDDNVNVVVTELEDDIVEGTTAAMASSGGDGRGKEETATDNEEGSDDPSSKSEEELKKPKCASDLYPPSFFTDDRGNLKFVNLVCRHPCKMFTAIIFLCLFLMIVLMFIVSRSGNPFADPDREYDMRDVRSLAYDSLVLANEEVEVQRGEVLAESENAKVIRPQEEQIDIMYWVFESETEEGLFGTRESIEAMREAQDLFTSDAEYESYCQKEYEETTFDNGTVAMTSKCRNPLSPLNMYYASQWDEELVQIVLDELQYDYPSNILRYNFLGVCVEFDLFCSPFMDQEDLDWALSLHYNISNITEYFDGQGETLNSNITQVTLLAAYLAELNTKRGLVDFGYDKNFSLTNQKSTYSRSILSFGGPLGQREVVGYYNRSEEDKDEKLLTEYMADTFIQDLKEMSSKEYDPEVNSYYFAGPLILDVLFDIASRDGALAGFSFLFVTLYIRISLGSWFLAAVGLLEIFLSIPVSWFIFSVCFRIQYFSFLNTLALFIVAAIGADDIFIFMDAYKQSATQISKEESYILESLENRMSWVYRRTGIAMGITSATTCLAFLCTLATPLVGVRAFGIFAALVILIDYILVMTLFCTAVVIYHNKFEKPGCCCCSCCSGGGCCRTIVPSPTMQAYENLTSDETTVEKDKISEFFGTKVAGFILDFKGRLLCGTILFSWLLAASIFSTRLQPTKQTEQFLDENHPLQVFSTILNEEFGASEDDPGLSIFFTWGLGGVDRTGVNLLLDPENYGKAIFVDSFDFNEECQREMVQICEDFKTNESYAPYIKQKEGLGTVKCFMDEFGAYSAVGSLDSCEIVRNGAWKQTNWTVPSEEFVPFMERFLEEPSCRAGGNTSIIDYYSNELGWNGTALKFAGVSIENSVLDPFTADPESVSREQYNAMMAISEELDARMQSKCGTKVIMTDLQQSFTFMNNQNIYVRSAVVSSLLGVCIAFVVLFISTRRLHIALLATLSIASVLVSVTGIMVMIGWELGTIESILISVVAGFSVDYVVHLAHSYESGRGDTETRIKKAFGEMGISVMNGMITSVGASIPLFFCQLTFFEKFGTFLCVIIAFSWIFANFAFMSVLAQLKIPISQEKGGTCHI